MAKRSRKIDTTTDSGGDRRSPDTARVRKRERAVTGGESTGDRTAGRAAGAKDAAADVGTTDADAGPAAGG